MRKSVLQPLRKPLAFLAGLVLVSACLRAKPPPIQGAHSGADSEGHWDRPLPPQGAPPSGGSEVERSMSPEACGSCHTAQLHTWRATRHARAGGPGLLGQLPGFGPAARASCLSCHAPLFEQQLEVQGEGGAWASAPEHDPELLAAGVTCATCHLRGWTVHGPPTRDGGERDMAGLPHDGFVVDPAFQRSEFCSGCHQFPSSWRSLNGKLLENTYEEWKESPQGQAGTTCQDCHMPDRAHLFLGIHDLATTRRAFTIEAGLTTVAVDGSYSAEVVLVNSGAGHHAPTYTTPRIEIDVQELGSDGRPTGPRSEPQVIQRLVVLGDGNDREVFDTRIAAGASRTFRFPGAAHEASAAVRVQIRVLPDFHYEGLFEGLLQTLPEGSEEARLIAEALTQARANHYVLFTEELELPARAP